MKLYAPIDYWDMPAEEKDRTCNGCGTKGLGGWFVPDTLWGLSITECCNIHDYMYSRGLHINDKDEADRAFLNNMLRVIDEGTQWKLVKWLRHRRAWAYYQVVSQFGGPAFWVDGNIEEEEREI